MAAIIQLNHFLLVIFGLILASTIIESSQTYVKRDAPTSDHVDESKKPSATKKPIVPIKTDAPKQVPTKSPSKSVTSTFFDELNPNSNQNLNLTFYDDDLVNGTKKFNATIEGHQYYNSTFFADPVKSMSYWVNISSFPANQIVQHEMLSNSHRRAATVALPFSFSFYGHPLTNITIATGGFIYAGDHVHSWLAATQYISALMANFDTSINNVSTIHYAHNDTAFVVQWTNVMLKDQKPPGNFTFQIILLKSGDIIFVYKDIPFSIEEIPDDNHPVKVGISDAYVIDRTVFFIRRKTVYEYHRADLKNNNITNNTAIYFRALPTCVSLKTCEECSSAKIGFECAWCEEVQRCSDGFDRHRQEWVTKSCEKSSKDAKCSSNMTMTTSSPTTSPSHRSTDSLSTTTTKGSFLIPNGSTSRMIAPSNSRSSSGGGGAVLSILVMFAFISGFALWVFYAYRNPQSSSGQFLIKYRPNRWRWGGSEARYTAASIHM